MNCQPFQNGDLFGLRGSSSLEHGDLIETVEAGANTITLVDPVQASRYVVGERLFVYGNQVMQFGYPPNVRFFEWHEIEDVTAGVITLRDRMTYRYDSTWKDADYSVTGKAGAGRIQPLNRPNRRNPRKITVRGLHVLQNPNGIHGAVIVAEYAHWLDCQFDVDVWPNQSRHSLFENCNLWFGANDVDKLNEIVEFRGCYGRGIVAATGTNHLIVDRCHLREGIRVSPRKLTLINSDIGSNDNFGVVQRYNDTGIGESQVWKIENNRFHVEADNLEYIINNSPCPSGEIKVTTASAGSFTTPNARLDDFRAITQNLWEGVVIRKGSKFARVKSIDYDGSRYVVTHDTNLTFTDGDALIAYPIINVEHSGNLVFRGGKQVDFGHRFLREGGPTFETRKEWRYTGSPSSNNRIMNTSWTGAATRMIYRVVMASAEGSGHRIQISAGPTPDIITAFSGVTTENGAYVVVDFIAGVTTFYGTWTRTSGLSGPPTNYMNGISEHRIFKVDATLAPSYNPDLSDVPRFELLLEGVTPVV